MGSAAWEEKCVKAAAEKKAREAQHEKDVKAAGVTRRRFACLYARHRTTDRQLARDILSEPHLRDARRSAPRLRSIP